MADERYEHQASHGILALARLGPVKRLVQAIIARPSKQVELEDGPLKAQIMSHARLRGFADVAVMVDRSAAPPFVAQGRVYKGTAVLVLAATWTARLAPAELLAVVDHELGHFALRHHGRQASFKATWSLVLLLANIFYLQTLEGLPLPLSVLGALWFLVGLTLACFVLRIFYLAFLRRQERQADAWAMAACRDPLGYAAYIHRVADKTGGAVATYAWWERLLFQTRPSLNEFQRQARELAAKYPPIPAAEEDHPHNSAGDTL